MDKIGYIYTFWDKKLKRYIYVGQTDDFNRRIGEHLQESKKNNPTLTIEIEIMEYGINNYNISKMKFPILELNNQERYFIRYFQTREYYGGCNLTDGGYGARGYKHTEEDIRKRAEKISTPKLGQSLGDLNLELSKQWHPTKNGDLTPFNVCPNSGKKVWWMCEKGHEWEATIDKRNNGTNCPKCANEKRKKDQHPGAKSYKITSPNNEIFIIKGILEKFCIENDLSYGMIKILLWKKYKYNDYKNWKIEYSTNEEYLKYKENNNVWFS